LSQAPLAGSGPLIEVKRNFANEVISLYDMIGYSLLSHVTSILH